MSASLVAEPIGSQEATLLHSIRGSAFLATAMMLKIKPCCQKLPCFKGRLNSNEAWQLRTMVQACWSRLSEQVAQEVSHRMSLYLFARANEYRWDSFLESYQRGSLAVILQDQFEDWSEKPTVARRLRSPLFLIVQVLRLDPRITKEEIDYLFERIPGGAYARINRLLVRILTRACRVARIEDQLGKPVLTVQFVDKGAQYVF